MSALLEVKDLTVRFRQDGKVTEAVKGVSFAVQRGETLALVGESGSGKSVTALSTVGLLGDTAEVGGSVRYEGRELIGASAAELRDVRGDDISFIFQEPMTSLNPLHTVEKQIAETLGLHRNLPPRSRTKRFLEQWRGLRPRPVFIGLACFFCFVFVYGGFIQTAPSLPSVAYFQDFLTTTVPLRLIYGLIAAALATLVLWLAKLFIERNLGAWLVRDRSRDEVLALLEKVGIDRPEERLTAYPHQLSGGQRQRVMIAMALANGPKLLIADEPTTALDVTIQAQILDLIAELQRTEGMSLLFITHDLGIVRRFADRVCVMQAGRIVEQGPVEDIFSGPQHDYTKMLLGAEQRGGPIAVPEGAQEVVRTEGLRVWFPIQRGLLKRTTGYIKAVNDASISVREGETLGIVGESGSGKTTLALAIMRLIRSEGRIVFFGKDIQGLRSRDLRPLRRDMQIVFQDPFGSLSPRMSAEEIISEGLGVHGIEPGRSRREMVAEIMAEVGLDPATMHRYPHEFSGGQRQRIAIARAMVLRPRLVVLDEPTSALDMTVQVQIVQLLRELQAQHRLAYLFISHDLKVIRALSHKIIVMRRGEIVESGPAAEVFQSPESAYTRELMAAAFLKPQPAA